MAEENENNYKFECNDKVNPSLVQICINRRELNRRISAFIERKRREVNELNNQEFFGRVASLDSSEDSCARVDLKSVPFRGGKSRFKVSRVENLWGPQTRARLKNSSLCKTEPSQDFPSQESILEASVEERLRNMESHLKLKSSVSSSGSTDVHRRLQELENRILFLEGISPEYFSTVQKSLTLRERQSSKWSELETKYKNCSTDEINSRIDELGQLLQKQHK